MATENPFPSNNMILWTRNWEKDSPDEQRLGERVDHETVSLWRQLVVPDGAIRCRQWSINYCRLWWQQQLSQSLVEMGTQQLATELGLTIQVCHFHQELSKSTTSFVCHYDQPAYENGELIANTTTKTGLKESCFTQSELKLLTNNCSINLERDKFHGEWNYKIFPKATQ